MHDVDTYAGFAEAAADTSDFEFIARQFSAVLDDPEALLDAATRSLVLASVGRALMELHDMAGGRRTAAAGDGDSMADGDSPAEMAEPEDRAEAALAAGDWASLRACAEAISARWPEREEGWRMAALAAQEAGSADEGARTLGELRCRFPVFVGRLRESAWTAYHAGALPLAILLWRLGRDCFADEPEMPHGLALALRAAGRIRESDAVLAAALAQFPRRLALRTEQGWNALKRDDWAAAKVIWGEVLMRDPEALGAWHASSIALYRGGEAAAAEQLLAEGMSRFPDHSLLAREHAGMAAARGDWGEAARRWTAVRARFPSEPDGYVAGGDCLLRAGRALYADRVSTAAVERWPDHAEAAVLQVRAAILAHDGEAAQARASAALLRFPGLAELHALAVEAALRRGELVEAQMLAQAGLAVCPGDVGIMAASAKVRAQIAAARPDAAPGALASAAAGQILEKSTDADPADAALMMGFESLGENCEFGIVQRQFGAEPLGLFRFVGVSAAQVAAALDDDLRGIGDPEFTYLHAAANGELLVRDRRYFMTAHTFQQADTIDVDRLLAGQCRRLRFLARKFRDDLGEMVKVFVFRATLPLADAQVVALHRALRRHGPAVLLCVRTVFGAEGEPAAGSVLMLREGLLVGHVGRLGQLADGTANSDFDAWLALCREVARRVAGGLG